MRNSEYILEELKKNNIKLSHQRLMILEYLIKNHNHPTVDEMYGDIKVIAPTLSKTTIYNTLNLFIEAGIVKALNIEDNEVRYDIVIDNHGHFKCDSCGQITDIEVDVDSSKIRDLLNYKIKQKNIYFKGVCPDCLSKGSGF